MAERHSKRTVSGDKPHIQSENKKKKVTPAVTISANTTTVVTKTLLDDAHNGFKNGNFICSPLSLEIILGMLAAGAEGETLKQLLEFLGHESVDQLLSESPTILSGGAGGVDLSLANAVWVDERLEPIRSCYQWVLKTIYKTKAKYVDFVNKVKLDEAVEDINSWVHKETKGLIPTIVKTGDFSPDDLMVFVNALYFKGAWRHPFHVEWTHNRAFHLINGEKVSVPFMTNSQWFDYGSFKGYKMIRFPYKSKDMSKSFSMYIFLPHEKDGLKDLLEIFHSGDALFHGHFDLKLERFDELWIPKFKISCSFEPEDVMKQMGFTLPFEKTNKELSGIVNMRGLYDNMLYVSKILQKSVIEVDEKGRKLLQLL